MIKYNACSKNLNSDIPARIKDKDAFQRSRSRSPNNDAILIDHNNAVIFPSKPSNCYTNVIKNKRLFCKNNEKHAKDKSLSDQNNHSQEFVSYNTYTNDYKADSNYDETYSAGNMYDENKNGALFKSSSSKFKTKQNQEENILSQTMGFVEFKSTKGEGLYSSENKFGSVRLSKKRRYRQYMNRVGGFNRPLDYIN